MCYLFSYLTLIACNLIIIIIVVIVVFIIIIFNIIITVTILSHRGNSPPAILSYWLFKTLAEELGVFSGEWKKLADVSES